MKSGRGWISPNLKHNWEFLRKNGFVFVTRVYENEFMKRKFIGLLNNRISEIPSL